MTIQQILKEATDFSNGKAVLKSIESGEAGISSKKFFEGSSEFSRDRAAFVLDSLIKKCEEYKLNRTKFIKLLLKKAQTLSNFLEELPGMDPFITYYKNVEKKEAKAEHKQLFDDFASSILNRDKDRAFEKKVNEIFAGKAQVVNKGKEIKQLYGPDAQGWETFIPLTFAAAKEYSTTKEGKTKWCTAANEHHYKGYTANGPLYIIRNYEKDLAYQINFSEHDYYGKTSVEFMDKEDVRPSKEENLREVLNKIPTKALEVVDFKGKSFAGLKISLRSEKASLPEAFKKTNFGDWEKSSFHVDNKKQIIAIAKDAFTGIGQDAITSYFNNKKEKDIGQVDIYRHKKAFGKSYLVLNSSVHAYVNLVLYDADGEIEEISPTDVPAEIYKLIYKTEKKDNKTVIEKTPEYTLWETRINGAGRREKATLNLSFKNDIRAEKEVGDSSGNTGLKMFVLNDFWFRESDYIIRFVRTLAAGNTKPTIKNEEAIANLFIDYKFENPKDKAVILKAIKRIHPNIGSELLSAALDDKRFGNMEKDRKQNVIDSIKRVKGKINDNTTASK